MSRRQASYLERTVDKWILGLAVATALAFAFAYGVRSPNRISYAGRSVQAAELNALILSDAERLQRQVRSATPTTIDVPSYARLVRQAQESSVLAASAESGPRLPARLERSTAFGQAIPNVVDSLEADAVVALITPLAPDQPVVRVGAHNEPPSKKDGSVWASVGAYFDLPRQREAAVKLGYADFRRQILLVGVDLQRREVSANAAADVWHDIPPLDGLAVRFDLPRPVFDGETGRCLNRAALADALIRVKAFQPGLMQPIFLENIVTGGAWRIPPLDGYRQREQAIIERLERDLKLALRALRRQEFDEAERLVVRTRDHTLATPKIVRSAERLVRIIARRRAAGSKSPQQPNRPIDVDSQNPPDQFIVAPGMFVVHPEDGRPAIWVHDTSVEPGRSYQYRLRVRLWNRYAGVKRPLIDPSGAERAALIGQWSTPSDPVDVPQTGSVTNARSEP